MRRAATIGAAAGLVLTLGALAPPVDARAESSLPIHMLQHLTLVFAAAPLLAWAGPMLVLSSRFGSAAVALLGRRAVRVAASPVVGWLALATVMTATHVPWVFDLVERTPPVHAAEHAVYLLAAILFWRPALGPEGRSKLSRPLRLPYLVSAMPAGDLVGMWLVTRAAPVYAAYDSVPGQRAAGAAMIGASIVLAVVAVREGWRCLTNEQRRADVAERLGARLG